MAATPEELRARLEPYLERIARMLGLDPGTVQMPQISLGQLAEDGQYAEGGGGRITVDPDYFKAESRQDIDGMLVHEAVHALTTWGDNPQLKKQVEPLADAIRYQVTGNQGGWQPSAEAMRLVDLAPWQLRVVQRTMSDGSFSNAILKGLEDGRITRESAAAVEGPSAAPSVGPSVPTDPGSAPGVGGGPSPVTTVPAGGTTPTTTVSDPQGSSEADRYLHASTSEGTTTGPGGYVVGSGDGGASKKEKAMAQALSTLHMNLWGSPPTDKWLKKQLDSGDSLFEIDAAERAKWTFTKTKTYQDELAGKAASMASALGFR